MIINYFNDESIIYHRMNLPPHQTAPGYEMSNQLHKTMKKITQNLIKIRSILSPF